MPKPLPPPDSRTLAGLLEARAARHPERAAFVFLTDGEGATETLTYARLWQRAGAIAADLRRHAKPGDRAMLLYAPSLAYVEAFWACQLAGLAAVPVYPPRDGKTAERLMAIGKDASAKLALTTADLLAVTGLKRFIAPGLRGMKWLATDTVSDGPRPVSASIGSSLALVQYTSGSTGVPKGVLVSQANLLHNASQLQAAWDDAGYEDETTTFVSWLPLYHDMGLIGKVVAPVYMGATCVLMSPLHFLQQPRRWLQAISNHRATVSAGPNFAYELCVNRLTDADVAGLDLSCWRVAMNGAEPVRSETLSRFARRFAPTGFKPTAFYPCYGMAEATLFVAGGRCEVAPPVKWLDAEALAEHRVVAAEPAAPRALEVVGVGRAWAGQEICIVNPETHEPVAPGAIGEIWVAGPSVAGGYWRRPEESAATFGALLQSGAGPYLRTGDLGFKEGDELFVTGRLKDLVIIRGRNLYPQDLEACVIGAHAGLRAGGGAAFGVDVAGEERLVVVQEVDRKQPPDDTAGVLKAARLALATHHEVTLHALVLVPAGSLPKTSSGKVQRHRAREKYLAGALPAWEARP